MENNCLFEKIKSKYICQKVFEYIKEENFKFKFLLYSKYFQKKLELEIIDFKERYIIQSKINFDNYLCCYSLFNADPKNFDKNIISKKLEEELIKYNLDINIIYEYLLHDNKRFLKIIKEKEKENKLVKYHYFMKQISIFSPFFDFLSKSEYFDLFTIPISVKTIERFNLKDEYIKTFENLNKLHLVKYPSIFFDYKKTSDINYLKEFKIRFGKIKRLIISHEFSIYIDNYDYFFKTLFSFNNIEKNIIHLNLFVGFIKKDKLDPNSLKNLNSFFSLEVLELKGFKFKTTFTLKLKNLKKLILKNCENLTFAENSCLNLKILYLLDCSIEKPKYLIKMPELEECVLPNNIINKQKYSNIIDFGSFEKIKKLTAETGDFINIKNNLLENITLYSYNSSSENEKIMLEKILSIKTLKDVNFEIKEIGDYEISNIGGENTSVINLSIKWINNFDDCTVYNLQNKFPYSSNISLYTPYKKTQTYLEIQENQKCKINKFSLKIGGYKNILFYCQSFENLISVDFFVNNDIINIIDSFPLFNDECKVIFKALKNFKFSNYSNEMNINFFNNVFNNIKCMPVLKKFDFHGINKDFTEDFYKKFMEKILILELDYVYFVIKKNSNDSDEKYKEEEIKEMFPHLKYIKLDKVNIGKLKK